MFRTVKTEDIFDQYKSGYSVSMQDEILYNDGILIVSKGGTMISSIFGRNGGSNDVNSFIIHGNYTLTLQSCYYDNWRRGVDVNAMQGLCYDSLKAFLDKRKLETYRIHLKFIWLQVVMTYVIYSICGTLQIYKVCYLALEGMQRTQRAVGYY